MFTKGMWRNVTDSNFTRTPSLHTPSNSQFLDTFHHNQIKLSIRIIAVNFCNPSFEYQKELLVMYS
jgi:hypothetical protein